LYYRRLNLTILRSFKLDSVLTQRQEHGQQSRELCSLVTTRSIHISKDKSFAGTVFGTVGARSVPNSAVRHGYFVTRKSHNSDFSTDITRIGNGRIRTSVSLHSLLCTVLQYTTTHNIITSGMWDIVGRAWASACTEHGAVTVYQDVTEHKISGHSTRNKMYRHAQHRNWVRLASPAGMSSPVCMVAACTQI